MKKGKEMKYKIKYAMSGGFGGLDNAEWEEIEVNTYQEAMDWAEEAAKDLFESYAGMHGVMDWHDIAEENPEYTEEDITDAYNNEVDSWIDYIAEEVK